MNIFLYNNLKYLVINKIAGDFTSKLHKNCRTEIAHEQNFHPQH